MLRLRHVLVILDYLGDIYSYKTRMHGKCPMNFYKLIIRNKLRKGVSFLMPRIGLLGQKCCQLLKFCHIYLECIFYDATQMGMIKDIILRTVYSIL